MKQKKPSLFKRILRSKLLIGAEIIILILVSVALIKELVRGYQVEKEVSALKKEIDSLESSRIELTELIHYFSSETYQEEQAKSKLGLMKPGESVIVMPETEEEISVLPEEETVATVYNEETSNPQKWWDYFFMADKEQNI